MNKTQYIFPNVGLVYECDGCGDRDPIIYIVKPGHKYYCRRCHEPQYECYVVLYEDHNGEHQCIVDIDYARNMYIDHTHYGHSPNISKKIYDSVFKQKL